MSAILFSTRNYLYLRDQLLSLSPMEKGDVEVRHFSDGELYQRIEQDVEMKDVYIIGGTINAEDTLELFDLACTCVKYGASSLTLIIPYFAYSTMERATRPGESVTAKYRALLFSSIPRTGKGNRVVLVDLHSEGIPHYFEGGIRPVHIYCKSLIAEAARKAGGDNFVLAATDAGRAKWVESLANDMKVEAALALKRRTGPDQSELISINADVKGRHVVIYDDMIRTGGSIVHAAEAYTKAGAAGITVICTHGLFINQALEKMQATGNIQQVIATNTHPNAVLLQNDFLNVLSIAPLLAGSLHLIK